MKKYDLIGEQFDRLTVTQLTGTSDKHHDRHWKCLCFCGKEIITTTRNLKSGNTKSCGCLQLEAVRIRCTTHGQTGSTAYNILHSAKQRAKKRGLQFNLDLEDIKIPEFCPVLGIILRCGIGAPLDSSPTLDRINSTQGYVRGNIEVISNRANKIKQNATAEELRKVADYVERKSV
jgi:hypothetical protein